MFGFEPRISGVGRDHSTNCATTTVAIKNICVYASDIGDSQTSNDFLQSKDKKCKTEVNGWVR